jgi:chemotaxis family two-component system response regulator Rcp1
MTEPFKRPERRPEILLVEDNPGDVHLISETLRELAPPHALMVVHDGAAVIELLRVRIAESLALPDLILLDLNLPRLDGHEVLGFLKSTHPLRRIPVVVLTSSQAELDIRRAYQLHANCYLVKPRQLASFRTLIRSLSRFWLLTAVLPTPSAE